MQPTTGDDAPREDTLPLGRIVGRGAPPALRVVGGHLIDRYLLVEWFSRTTPVTAYRRLHWLGRS